MKKERGDKIVKAFLLGLTLLMLVLPLASAGVGIKWSQESSLITENSKTCMTYKVYNPWPEDSYVKVELSSELMEIFTSASSEIKFIPKNTPSSEAIPVEFCFKTPKVYEEDCLLFNNFICEQECLSDMVTYEGEVQVMEVAPPDDVGDGAGGSSTSMSVSAPLRVKVSCEAHSRNYSLIYLVIIIIAGILLAINLFKKKKKKR